MKRLKYTFLDLVYKTSNYALSSANQDSSNRWNRRRSPFRSCKNWRSSPKLLKTPNWRNKFNFCNIYTDVDKSSRNYKGSWRNLLVGNSYKARDLPQWPFCIKDCLLHSWIIYDMWYDIYIFILLYQWT